MLTLDRLKLRQGEFALASDFSVDKGTKIALIGPSGAGKSTLIAAIAGFLTPETGRITWSGQDITGLEPGQRPVSILFQDNNLFPHLSIAQNVGLGIRPALRLSGPELAKVEDALSRVGLKGYGARKPGDLSGGQQSRAALARALVQGKSWMVLDEPFAALGPALRADMLDLVAQVASDTGAGVLMVTHAPEDARRIADKVVFVEGGIAHPPQPTALLLDNPPPALKAYLG